VSNEKSHKIVTVSFFQSLWPNAVLRRGNKTYAWVIFFRYNLMQIFIFQRGHSGPATKIVFWRIVNLEILNWTKIFSPASCIQPPFWIFSFATFLFIYFFNYKRMTYDLHIHYKRSHVQAVKHATLKKIAVILTV
jgi:hypothetical protein